MINLSAVALPLAFGKSIYSQISPCRHPAITDTPIIWTAVKSQEKINYRDLTEINSRYCGLEVHELEVPTTSTTYYVLYGPVQTPLHSCADSN